MASLPQRGQPGQQAPRGRLRLVASEPAQESLSVSSHAEGPSEAVAIVSDLSPDEAKKKVPSEAPPSGVRQARNLTLSELPDAELVVLGCKGNTAALGALYKRHAPFAINLAARIEGSSRDIEDIVHDAFLKAFERLNDLSDRAAFRSWLGAIVVHQVRSRMRRARLMSVLGLGKNSEPVDLDAIASVEASPHTRAQIAQIYALLRTLPTDDRIAWTLRSVEGHDLETVARLTDCSLATVKRRISRAQRFLDEYFVDPSSNKEVP